MEIKTPAFVLNEAQLLQNLTTLASIREQSGCKILYAIKALPCVKVLEIAKPFVNGFAVSSLFEAHLAREVLAGEGEVHLTSPAFLAQELYELSALCTHINFNSLSQHARFSDAVEAQTQVGLRVNPKISVACDERFNACRQHSKLGVNIDTLWHSNHIEQIQGLHFHTVFGATDFKPLLETIEKLRSYFGNSLKNLKWLNFGGGYLFHKIENHQPFIDLVIDLKRELNIDCYLEIGNGVVGNAAQIVASVIDVFESDSKTIAILDTSVNHNPEVFEYQRSPIVREHNENGRFSAILAGGTCLAGDIFGQYRFQHPLQIGDQITFENVGAYSLIKASRFNGHNLPSIYLQRENGQIELIKAYGYQDFLQQWG